jgi:hypothetical protein
MSGQEDKRLQEAKQQQENNREQIDELINFLSQAQDPRVLSSINQALVETVGEHKGELRQLPNLHSRLLQPDQPNYFTQAVNAAVTVQEMRSVTSPWTNLLDPAIVKILSCAGAGTLVLGIGITALAATSGDKETAIGVGAATFLAALAICALIRCRNQVKQAEARRQELLHADSETRALLPPVHNQNSSDTLREGKASVVLPHTIMFPQASGDIQHTTAAGSDIELTTSRNSTENREPALLPIHEEEDSGHEHRSDGTTTPTPSGRG